MSSGLGPKRVISLSSTLGLVRSAACDIPPHLYAITHIFCYGRSIFTLDELGKGLIFAPDPESSEDISMVFTQARVVRVAEKQDFIKLIGGKLWVASRTEQQIIAPPDVRAPFIIRVFSIQRIWCGI
jgi:hypothetical protein